MPLFPKPSYDEIDKPFLSLVTASLWTRFRDLANTCPTSGTASAAMARAGLGSRPLRHRLQRSHIALGHQFADNHAPVCGHRYAGDPGTLAGVGHLDHSLSPRGRSPQRHLVAIPVVRGSLLQIPTCVYSFRRRAGFREFVGCSQLVCSGHGTTHGRRRILGRIQLIPADVICEASLSDPDDCGGSDPELIPPGTGTTLMRDASDLGFGLSALLKWGAHRKILAVLCGPGRVLSKHQLCSVHGSTIEAVVRPCAEACRVSR
jgi:hypothetical protein